jgi:hypothetical protein
MGGGRRSCQGHREVCVCVTLRHQLTLRLVAAARQYIHITASDCICYWLSARSVTVNGSVAYAAQTPFLTDRSVRDNILFGLEYEPSLYAKACPLVLVASTAMQQSTMYRPSLFVFFGSRMTGFLFVFDCP